MGFTRVQLYEGHEEDERAVLRLLEPGRTVLSADMSLAAGVIFKTSEAVEFVAELARWISPPTELSSEAPTPEVEGEEPPPPTPEEPSAFQQECAALEAQQDFQQLSSKLATALKERLGSEPEDDVECAYTVLLQLLMRLETLPRNVRSCDALCSCRCFHLCSNGA